MKNTLIFGNVNTKDFGAWVTGSQTYSAPERDIEIVSVPGRNGDLIIDNGKWNNIEVSYPAFIQSNFDDNMSALRSAMCRQLGYQRLEDSYHPEEFRLGTFVDGIYPDMRQRNESGEFTLRFNCKPQRFLKSGEEPIQIMPIYVIGTELSSQVVPVKSDLSFTVKCATSDTLSIDVTTYDENIDEIDTTTYSCENGDQITHSFENTDKYWVISITGQSSISTTSLRIQTVTEYNGEALPIDAIMCRNFSLLNPTGYASKPLIEVYGATLGAMTIENIDTAGETESRYIFNIANTGKQHFYMDCDMQYVYADDKTNLTDKLFLTTMESDVGQGLVFPDLGTNQINFQTYFTTGASSNGIGLVLIYPRWWKL